MDFTSTIEFIERLGYPVFASLLLAWALKYVFDGKVKDGKVFTTELKTLLKDHKGDVMEINQNHREELREIHNSYLEERKTTNAKIESLGRSIDTLNETIRRNN